ncbi:MAG: ComF family protein [Candidatus Woesebacteria bacterium]|nr:ComF family protein [Candidatus Woesebacteria bacterium]
MSILDLVFPKTCLGCGRLGSYICSDCVAKVRLAQPICPYCERASIDGITHVRCQKKLGLDGLISIWEYEGVIRKAILALKYKYATLVGQELTDHFLHQLLTGFLPVNSKVLVPIPLYWYRENTRGFNQSIEIGKSISEAMNWKFLPDLLIKKQSTISQVELKGDDRRQNLRGVFTANPIHKSLFVNLNSVIVFDDVFTTGSTLREAAKVLKRAGVEKVWGMTIAR